MDNDPLQPVLQSPGGGETTDDGQPWNQFTSEESRRKLEQLLRTVTASTEYSVVVARARCGISFDGASS